MTTPKIETRTINATLRASSDNGDMQLAGVAVSYGILSQDLGGFRECFARGAFTRALKGKPDVKCLLNHSADIVLGRTTNNTLSLMDGENGLGFVCQLNPASQQHRDIHASIERGDISECSFAFKLDGDDGDDADEWSDKEKDERGVRFVKRTVKKALLFDVSAVTFPAYNASGATKVNARATNYVVSPAGVIVTKYDVGAEIDKFNRTRLAEQAREIERQS